MVKSKLVCSGQELLKSFSDRCNDLMWAMTEEAIRGVMPEGVNVASWTRTHGLTVGIDDFPDRIRHRVFKDGNMVAEVLYKNGIVSVKVHMGRGVLVDVPE